MPKKYQLLALGSFLLIPCVTIAAALVFASINPEWGAGSDDYEKIFRILTIVRQVVLGVAILAGAILWFLTCYFVVRGKDRSMLWLGFAPLGPAGVIVLLALRNGAIVASEKSASPAPALGTMARFAWELAFLAGAACAASAAVVGKRSLLNWIESVRTKVPVEAIVQQQVASSGMHAFSEAIEFAFLLVLLYLLRPVVAFLWRRFY